ncbi:MAG: hypothetical protein P1Q69_20505 [Candidatus Thorarchaeota archaeon]|nr:hypothetical protein [Candidatus Thorarchaeota archaeon]
MSLIIKRQLAQMAKDNVLEHKLLSQLERELNDLSLEFDDEPSTFGWDLMCFKIHRILREDASTSRAVIRQWDMFWSNTSKQHRYSTNLNYDCPRVYTILDTCEAAFSRLAAAYTSLRSLPPTEFDRGYLDSFFKIRLSCKPILTQNEREYFIRILEMQTFSPSLLGRTMEQTTSHASKIVARLSKKHYLTERISMAYAAVRMKVIFLMIEMDSLDANLPISLSHKNPWIYSLFDCKYGNRFVLVHLIVPDQKHVEDLIDDWCKRIQEIPCVRVVNVFYRVETQSWRHFNYDWFDGERWRIPGELYGPHIKASFNSSSPSPLEKVPPPNLEGYQLRKEDVRILSEFWMNGPLPLRLIRERVGMDYTYVRKRLRELFDRSIMKKRIQPSQFFATEALVLVAELPIEKHHRLCRALSVVPELYSMRTSSGHSFIILRLPDGQSPFLSSDLRELLVGNNLWLNQYIDMIFVDWAFPIERFNEYKHKWIVRERDFST